MEIAKKHEDQLPRLKKDVDASRSYWDENYTRFNEFRQFVFNTSITGTDKDVLEATGKPIIEFNITEAYISRQRGEFAKQEPNVKITAEDGEQVSSDVIDVVAGHLKHMFSEANKDGVEYHVYTDTLSGGFSALKVWTEYAHEMSMDQVIKFGRVYDPTMTGFDPLARKPHKGDGRYCYELFPKDKKDVEEEYGLDLKDMQFTRSIGGFNWSYNQNKRDILLICDFYEKKRKKTQIVKLANDTTLTMDDYKAFLVKWNESGIIEQPPGIKGKPRWTMIDTIVRYRFIENKLLEYTETNFKMLPIVFIDGNSILLRDLESGAFQQMTRPYIYHAKGMQKLKNFAGQTLANELENMVAHKFKVAVESLPDQADYLKAYTNLQIADTLVYKAFKDNDPKQPVPPPQEIVRVPAPPEVINTFSITDQGTQGILGSYDASLGINDNQLSGSAIIEGATQSNAAAMPYIISFMHGLNQVANLIVDLMPKYYLTPRTLPIIRDDGSRDFRKINDENGVQFSFNSSALNVKVEAGVNFAIQKSRGLNQIISMSQASPVFAQFMNSKGLKVLLDYFDIEGVEKLKELADEFMQEMAQQQEQQQQMARAEQQNNPAILKAKNEQMSIQRQAQADQVNAQLQAAKIATAKQQATTNFMKVLADMHRDKAQTMVDVDRADAERARASADVAIKAADMHHTHRLEAAEFHHKVHLSQKEQNNDNTTL